MYRPSHICFKFDLLLNVSKGYGNSCNFSSLTERTKLKSEERRRDALTLFYKILTHFASLWAVGGT